jgi:LysR family glycine cleavage system transcriptional activator
VQLTEAGRALLGRTVRALEEIEAGLAEVHESGRGGTLEISVLPSFAQCWLLARIGRFGEIAPHCRLQINATQELIDFRVRRVHAAVRYGRGGWRDLRSTRVAEEQTFAACAPSFADGLHELRHPQDLLDLPLVHDRAVPWSEWIERVGGTPPSSLPAGSTFDDSGLVITAAREGHGVALVRGLLAYDDLAAGRLVRLGRWEAPAEYAYYFVRPERSARLEKVLAYEEWLRDELAACGFGSRKTKR